MRIAVSLPSLSAGAVERGQIEAVVGELASRCEVELFAETTRLREGDLPAPAWHYLRLPERCAAAPFDVALHIIGRDFRPSEPSVLLARRLPGLVWVPDTTAHHVLVGALGGYGRWDEYTEVLADHVSNGAAIAATISAGWGTRALFRFADPVPGLLRPSNRVVAASNEIAARLGDMVPVVPLPENREVLEATVRAVKAVERIAVIAPNFSWPLPELRALARVIHERPGTRVDYHLIKIFEPAVRTWARAIGIDEAVHWIVEDGVERRREVADRADLVVATTGDPTLGEQSLVKRALASGQICVVTRAPAWEQLPAASAVVVEPGRERETGLSQALLELTADADFAAALARNAATKWREISVRASADALLDQLEQAADRTPPRPILTARLALDKADKQIRDSCLPHNASKKARELIEDVLAALQLPAEGPERWQ